MQPSHLDQLSSDLPVQERRQFYHRMSAYQQSNKRDVQEIDQDTHPGSSPAHSPLQSDFIQTPLLLRIFLISLAFLKKSPPETILLHLRLKRLRKRLQNGPEPILKKQGKRWCVTPLLAQKVYAVYNNLFLFPFDLSTMGNTSRILAAHFLTSPSCPNLQLDITSFCSEEEVAQVVCQEGNSIALWAIVKERLEGYFIPLSSSLAKHFLNQSSFAFQIARMKAFPFRKFFAIFLVLDLPGKGKPQFQPAPLDDKARKLLGQLFCLLEETGPLLVPQSAKDLIFSEKIPPKQPILEKLDEGMRMLKADWAKLLRSQQTWDLMRYITGSYYLNQSSPRFRHQEYIKETRAVIAEHYFTRMKEQFDQYVSREMVYHLERIRKIYLPNATVPLKHYNDRFNYPGAEQHELVETMTGTTKRGPIPRFIHGKELALLRAYSLQWLAKQLTFLDRLSRNVWEGHALRTSGAKIIDSLADIDKRISSLDYSLAPRSPRGLQLKDLRLRLIHGQDEALPMLAKLMDEINNEADLLVESCVQALERVLGYVKRIIHQSSEIIPRQASPHMVFEEKSGGIATRLQHIEQGLTDFLYLLRHHQQLPAANSLLPME